MHKFFIFQDSEVSPHDCGFAICGTSHIFKIISHLYAVQEKRKWRNYLNQNNWRLNTRVLKLSQSQSEQLKIKHKGFGSYPYGSAWIRVIFGSWIRICRREKMLDPDPHLTEKLVKSWIRIRIKIIRIHNPGSDWDSVFFPWLVLHVRLFCTSCFAIKLWCFFLHLWVPSLEVLSIRTQFIIYDGEISWEQSH
jgi:hypothetical protein